MNLEIPRLLDGYAVPACLVDARFRVLYFNDKARQEFGLKLSEKSSSDFISILLTHAKRKKPVRRFESFLQIKSTLHPVSCEWITLSRSRHVLTMTPRVAQLDAIFAIDAFRNAVNEHALISVIGSTGEVLYCNERFTTVTGFTQEDVIQKKIETVLGLGRKSLKTLLQPLGKLRKGDLKCRTKNGSFCWLDTELIPAKNGLLQNSFIVVQHDVTSRKIFEEVNIALQHSLDEFRIAVTNASIISRADRTGAIIYVNENFERISGYAAEELIGQTHRIINSGHHPPAFWKTMWKAIVSGNMWRQEVRNRSKDGRYYWVDTFIMPIRETDGTIREFLSIRNDITARKEAEENIVRYNTRLRETLLFGKMGSVVFSPSRMTVCIGEEFLVMLGRESDGHERSMSLEQFLNTYFRNVDAKRLRDILLKKKTTEGSQEILASFSLLKPQGPPLRVDAKVITRPDEVLLIFEDVTSNLEHQREAVNKRRALENILDGITDGFFALDHEMRFTMLNAVFEENAGLQESDMLGQRMLDLFPFMRETELYARYERSIKTGKSDTIEVFYDTRGTYFTVHMYPNPDGLFVFFKDITDSKKAQEELIGYQNKINAFFFSVTDSNFLLDANMRIVAFNKTGSEYIRAIHGVDPQIGELITTYGSPESNDAFKSFFNRALKGEEITHEVKISYREKNISNWWNVRYLPARNSTGEIIGVAFNATNIDAQKRAAQALMASDELLKKLSANVAGVIFSFCPTPNPRFSFVSDGSTELLGVPAASLMENYSLFLSRVHESDRNLFLDSIREAAEKTELWDFEFRIAAEHDSVRWVHVQAQPIQEPDGTNCWYGYMYDQTEKREAENENKMLGLIANRTTNGVVLTDAHGRITWVNAGFERITGYLRDEVIGQKPGKLLQGQGTDPATIAMMRSKLQHGEGFKTVILNYTKSKTPYWNQLEVIPYFEQDGSIQGFMAIQLDITELRAAIQTVSRSQSQLKTIFDHAPMVVFMKDAEGKYIFTNKAFHEAIGREVLPGQTDFDIFPEEFAKECRKKDSDILAKGELLSFEHIVNGRIFYETKFPIRDHDGNPYALGGMSLDMTERMQMMNAIRESEEMISTLADNLPNGVICKFEIDDRGLPGSFHYVSSGASDLFGVSPEEMIQDPGAVALLIPREDLTGMMRAGVEAKSELKEFNFEFRVKTPQGVRKWIQSKARPRRMSDGKVIWDGISLDITEQKNNQDKLNTLSTRLTLATEAAHLGIWEWDVQENASIWNEKMYELFDVPLDERKQKFDVWSERIHPADRERTHEDLQQALKVGGEFRYEFRVLQRNGRVRHLMTSGVVHKNSDGVAEKVIGVDWDVTDIKDAELALKLSEQRFRAFMKHTPVAAWITDEEGRISFVNDTYFEFFSIDARSALGKTMFDVFPTDVAVRFAACISEVAATGKLVKTMETAPRRNGSMGDFLIYNFPMGSFSDKVLVGGVVVDVTEQNEIEKSLRQSEARYRSIVDDQIEMICRYTTDGRITFANKAFVNEFGERLAREGTPVHDLFVSADEKRNFEEHLNSIIHTESPVQPREHFAVVAQGMKWIEWFDVPLRDARGNVFEIQAIGHDITERKRLEAEQARLNKIVTESHNEIFLLDFHSLRFRYANASALANIGYSTGEFHSMFLTDLFSQPDQSSLHTLLNPVRRGERDRLELQLKFRRKDGSQYDADMLIQVLEPEETMVAIVSDITAKIITERKLLDTIQEKEVLIKEIHHRVKNNLQLISSIIYLKMASKTDDLQGFLDSMRHKIRSIALIHERLLQSKELDQVKISEYLGNLLDDIRMSYSRPELSLEFESRIEPLVYNIDTAILCGLMVNEIVTNSIKHAFKGRSSGLIGISLQTSGNAHVLEIYDNGLTLPEHINLEKTNSFGMQLIFIFAKQLKGEVKIIRDSGTRFKITF